MDSAKTKVGSSSLVENLPVEMIHMDVEERPRFATSSTEFNRVLGGGVVRGSVVLLSGDPGIGKSTILLQLAALIAGQGKKVLYVSGEESAHQTKARADRLGIKGEGFYLLCETHLETILHHLKETSPELAVIDSIQTVFLEEVGGASGSMSQIRECALQLIRWAKTSDTPLFVTGHVTKEGTLAGPRILEHMVDVVLYLEGSSFSSHRLLRGVKNRFGSTNEVGVFEMREQGMVEISNPSQYFLSSRFQGAIGSVVSPIVEGTRPLLVEIQALTTTSYGVPRRVANGIDFNRLLLLIAVLTKRAGLQLANQDVIINVVGGLKINEPAVDLAVAMAIASSLTDHEVDSCLAVVGEVGLSGEVRAISHIDRRVAEAARQGFTRCIVPKGCLDSPIADCGMKIVAADSIREALEKGILPR